MKVRAIIEQKSREIFSAEPEMSLCQAMDKMLEKNVTALLVMQKDKLEGILSQRDVMRICHISSNSPKELKVRDFMTRSELLYTCGPDDTIEKLMDTMTEKRIKHIPVIENDKLIGVISIGDIVKNLLDAAKSDNKLLNDYISGTYPQ
jgi:CBS domain-containing protein